VALLNLATSEALLAAVHNRGIDPLRFESGYENRADCLRDLHEVVQSRSSSITKVRLGSNL
jgi:hypothetical protein